MARRKITVNAPPVLPLAPGLYDRAYTDQLNNILRLYFTSVDGLLRSLISENVGGAILYFPNGAFYNDGTQEAGAADTAIPVKFGNDIRSRAIGNDSSFGVAADGQFNINVGNINSVSDISKITVAYRGVYQFLLTLSVNNTTAGAKSVIVWLRKNGVDVAFSAKTYKVPEEGFDLIVYDFTANSIGEENFQLMWRTSDTALRLEAQAQTGVPTTPSATISVSYISAFEIVE